LTRFPAPDYNRTRRKKCSGKPVGLMTVPVVSREPSCSAPRFVSGVPGALPSLRPEFYRSLISGGRRGVKAAVLRAGLSLLSGPYHLGVALRNRLFDLGWKRAHRAHVPVVSVGNLTLGGTGKTPAVEYVARFYRNLERRIAILSRGYGSANGRNDEAVLLEENLPGVPHLQAPDRVALARIAVRELKSEVLILDDGFQHRRLWRDLDIVLIDATEPWGYGRVFPRGLLREPRSNLRRAHLILLTRCDQVRPEALDALRTEIGRLVPGKPVAESVHRPERLINCERDEGPLSLLLDRPIAAFCGLGNPEAFRKTLLRLGCHLTAFEVFPDHHRYSRADGDRLCHWARQLPADAAIVTSQKDLVKIRLGDLSELCGRPLWGLQVRLRLTAGQEIFDRMLKGVIA
jgi:tetraacyldisaccharide 4'-kinase